jgi:serine/threonine-protein kinase RsbW
MMENIPIAQDLQDKIRLCFYEVVTNAVVHGNRYDSNKRVWIRTDFTNDVFALSIQDEGCGFNLNQIPNPIHSDNIEKVSGRGLFFVKENSQQCVYCPDSHTMKIEWKL